VIVLWINILIDLCDISYKSKIVNFIQTITRQQQLPSIHPAPKLPLRQRRMAQLLHKLSQHQYQVQQEPLRLQPLMRRWFFPDMARVQEEVVAYHSHYHANLSRHYLSF
jgi:hypothetical protein